MYLKELVDIQMGQSPESKFYNYDKIGLPFYQGKADFGRINPTPKMWCSKSKKEAKPNDILISVRAPVGDLNINKEQSCIGRGLAAITCKSDVDMMYLYYHLIYLKPQLRHISTGSTFESINRSQLENLIITYKSYAEQIKISNTLNVVQRQIEVKENLLSLCDLLIKSRFVELFGDIELNEKKWKKIKFDELIKSANNGLARRGNNKDGNIVLRLIELQENSINYSSPNRIFLTDDEKKRYRLLDGDLLFARVNGNPNNVGRCAPFYECEEQVYHNDHIIRTSCDKSQLDSVFAAYLFNSEYGKNRISKKIKTSAGQYTINQEGLKSIEIILPPIVIQYSFAKFVKQINKLKSDVQKSIDETQLLMDSLMQEYFG